MSALHHDDFTEQMFKQIPKECYLRTNSVRHSDDHTEREYHIYTRDTHEKRISFRARRLPGCCGVLVLYYLRPNKDLKHDEQRAWFLDARQMVMVAAGLAKLGTVIMTQTKDSAGAKAIATSKNGPLALFTNWKTKNDVFLYMNNTQAPPAPAPAPAKFDDEYGDY